MSMHQRLLLFSRPSYILQSNNIYLQTDAYKSGVFRLQGNPFQIVFANEILERQFVVLVGFLQQAMAVCLWPVHLVNMNDEDK